jgi:hypothetical protein
MQSEKRTSLFKPDLLGRWACLVARAAMGKQGRRKGCSAVRSSVWGLTLTYVVMRILTLHSFT